MEVQMIISFASLGETRSKHTHNRVVLVCGSFDLLNSRHIAFLEQCSEKGNILVVAVFSDAQVREMKGSNRPIIPETSRAAILAALSVVTYVVLAPDPARDKDIPIVRVIRALKPHVFVTSDEGFAEHEGSLGHSDMQVLYLPKIGTTSPSIIQTILDRYSKQ